MTPKQCIEARRTLGLTRKDLATATGIASGLIASFEKTGHMPRPKHGLPDRIGKLRTHFEMAGVKFADEVPAGRSAAERQIMTPKQCKEARRLLGWSRDRLGGASVIPTHVIAEFELTGRVMGTSDGVARPERLQILHATLEQAGVEFGNEKGSRPGVRLRRAAP